VCIISEFGEEFFRHRVEIANIFNNVFKAEAKKNSETPVKFLPADIGLRANSEGNIRAITGFSENNKPNYEYVAPCNICVDGDDWERYGDLYYFDETRINEKNAAIKIMDYRQKK